MPVIDLVKFYISNTDIYTTLDHRLRNKLPITMVSFPDQIINSSSNEELEAYKSFIAFYSQHWRPSLTAFPGWTLYKLFYLITRSHNNYSKSDCIMNLQSNDNPSFIDMRLECTKGTSDKFWFTFPIGNSELITVYGRNGTSGKAISKTFTKSKELYFYMVKKLDEKLGKGYEFKSFEIGFTL